MAVTLTTYLTRTKQLLQNPSSAASKLFTDGDLTDYINISRGQLAGESESIRNFATLPVVAGTRVYNFSSIALTAPTTGIQGVFNVRQSLVGVGDGSVWMHPRSFEWFTLYALNDVVPPNGPPVLWAQYGQGVTGSLYFDPIPDQAYTLNLDTICYPVDLVDDTTDEAIPYPWTDCVPFFAAYYALMGAQRQTDADEMLKRYENYVSRARGMSNPDVLPQNYLQPPQDPTMGNRLGVKAGGRAQ